MRGVLAAMLAELFQLNSVGIVFLVLLCVIVSLLAFAANECYLDSCIIRHIFRHLLNKFARTLRSGVRTSLGKRHVWLNFGAFQAQQKSSVRRGRMIIPHIFLYVNSFSIIFCFLFT